MIIGDDTDRYRLSQIDGCVRRAHLYHLTMAQARDVVDRQLAVIDTHYDDVCEEAGLGSAARAMLRRVIPHPYALEGYHSTLTSG